MGTESEFKLITYVNFEKETCLVFYEGEYKDKKLTIPEGIEVICSESLADLDIEEITLPESLREIKGIPFRGCNNLKIINFGSQLSYFDIQSLRNLKNIEQINGSSPFYKSINGFLCDKDNDLIFCPRGKITKEVVLPEGIEYLSNDYNPFLDRSDITSLILPISLKNICSLALLGLTNVHTLHFPENVAYIENRIIADNSNITSWTIDKSNPNYLSIPNCLYACCHQALIGVSKSSTSSFTLPSDCKIIQPNAFENSNFSSITIPKSIDLNEIILYRPITAPLFNNCANLKELHIENRECKIKEEWFVECREVKTLPYTEEDYDKFRHLVRFFYPSQLEYTTKLGLLKDIVDLLLNKYSKVTDEWRKDWLDYFKRSRKKFYSYIISNKAVYNLYIQNELLSVGNLQDLIQLSNENNLIELSGELLEYENTHFSMKEILNESNKAFKIENPSSVKSLRKIFNWQKNEDDTITILSYKGNEEEVIIPDTIAKCKVTIIGEYAFSPYQSRLKWYTEQNRKKIKKVFLPSSIIRIDDAAFYHCHSLQEIIFPDGLLEIRDMTFKSCSSLTSITIPKKVKEINLDSFNECKEIFFLNKNTVLRNESTCWPYSSYKGIIKSIPGGKVEQYARENEIDFIPMEDTINKKDY